MSRPLVPLVPLAAALLLVATLAGCSTPNPHPDLDDHLLLLDAEGQVVDHAGRPLRDAKRRIDAMLDAMVRWLDQAGRDPQVVIHVHGGLTTVDSTIERASALIDQILESPTDPAWPIFVSWPSGGLASWWEGTWKLRNGKHERVIGPISFPLYVAADLLQGTARAPVDMVYLLKNDIEEASIVGLDLPLSEEWTEPEDLARAMEADPERRDHISIGPFRRGFVNEATRTLVWFVTILPKLVVTPLFLDGLGNTAWRTMRHRAFNSGRPSEEFEETIDSPTAAAADIRLDATPTGGLALLMGALEERIKEARKSGKTKLSDPFRLALIGHSMGAILLNFVLELQPNLPATDIVYMAPACSVAEAARSLVPFLRRSAEQSKLEVQLPAPRPGTPRHGPANFWLLTLHPLAEAGEMYPEYLDLPARGSLLEWIDDWYTSASHPLDRMFGKWNNALPALHLFESVHRQVHVKAFGLEDGSLPQRHGDFNQCPFWTRAFWNPEGTRWVREPVVD
jgi:hypothetical protein